MLKLSKTAEYAFRVMSHVATDEDKLFRSDDLSKDLDIPLRYLRRILSNLASKGLLTSFQGKYGGFKLGKAKKDINLLNILDAVEEKKTHHECFFGFEKCPIEHKCSMHDQWVKIQTDIYEVMESTCLIKLSSDSENYFAKRIKNKE